MEYDCLGSDDGRVPGPGGPPAEVKIGPSDRQLVVESEGVEHLAPHQHAGGVHREHLPDRIVLALVVLAALESGLPHSGTGDRHAELEQPPEGGPFPELGADHVGGRVGLGRSEQLLETTLRRGGLSSWRIQTHSPGNGGSSSSPRRTAAAKMARLRDLDDVLNAQPGPQQGKRLASRAALDGADPVGLAGLLPQTVEDRRQPARPIVADQQRRHVDRHGAPL